ncbi:MAG: hypothetical protein AABX54_05115 [Nanoarchaeota archaeon]
MSFHFKYKPAILKSGSKIYRPMIPLRIKAKESFDALAILDSGSDITIIPKEIAEVIRVDYKNDNSISGISGFPIRAKEGKVNIEFGKGREIYIFEIPVLVPEKENLAVIIGRLGFFEQFKITFDESKKRIEFKKSIQSY